ncbi:hypothetical protein MNBD_GAMMA05-152 [hydrothermal vent metagenome]|uniref:Uncharacterized protein n=1 Tax=hydrothermal vent metagenome TaxID=652676 RepID=A0A3B0X8I7_9ZZZZ
MNIKQSEALEIAKKFTLNEYSESKFSIVDEDYKISFEVDGFGHTVLELDENYWLITFTLKNTEKSMFDFGSEYFIVLVGAESGVPHWLPMM